MTVVIAKGARHTVLIAGEECEVIPYVGVSGEGALSQLGVGYALADSGSGPLWGPVVPHLLIRSWRAMKLIERLPVIDNSTLANCWTVAVDELLNSDWSRFQDLAHQFGSVSAFEAVRLEILGSVPTAAELDGMLSVIRDNDIEVSSHELVELAERGLIPDHPLIGELVAREAEQRAEYAAREAFLTAEMPEGESLGAYFAEIGVEHLLDGIPFGGYGMDWGHLKLDQLDEFVKRYSTGPFSEGHSFPLRRTEHGPDAREFGQVIEPWVITRDGARWTFVSAAYIGESIYIRARCEQRGQEIHEDLYTVSELRQAVGAIRQRWYTRFRLSRWPGRA